jgi:hypothetical protein
MVFTVTIRKIESFDEGVEEPWKVRFITKSGVMYDSGDF